MRLGIVGHEAAKFDGFHEALARLDIRRALRDYDPAFVVSGRCPFGGIDIWAEEIAKELGVPTLIHAPTVRNWSAPGGYRERNLKIAQDSDLVLVIVVAKLPEGYRGRRFESCYHCRDRNAPHVKSGACWTARKAKQAGWIIL